MPLPPRVISATIADQDVVTADKKLLGESSDARGVAVTGSFSRADWACVATGANIQSKK